ncbi:MAG: DUF4328 domain-containing protein [Polyangiaceae bacterium]|nr:DUF4328 domain-containing protein [Polyangiaceae bacterium]
MGYPPSGHAPGVSPDAVGSAATPALALIGFRAALPIIFYFVPLRTFVSIENGEVYRLVRSGIDGVFAILALIFYFVWFAKMYSWVRANRGGTQYSNGMAIGGWFIPFANFVIPYKAMRDAWRRANNDENSILVVGWWLTYLLTIVVGYANSSFGALFLNRGLDIDLINLINTLLYWGGVLLQMTTWGLLALLVQTLTKRITAR